MPIKPSSLLDNPITGEVEPGRITTLNGGGWYPMRKDPGEPDLEEIAHGLAHTFRYGGQTQPGITVAEHCVLVADLIEALWPQLRPKYALAGLFHDTVEAYLHDIQYGLKCKLLVSLDNGETVSWKAFEDRLINQIGGHFGLSPEILTSEYVKAADILAASFERRDCKTLKDIKGVPAIPDEVKHLGIRFWGPSEAKGRFLRRAEHLLARG